MLIVAFMLAPVPFITTVPAIVALLAAAVVIAMHDYRGSDDDGPSAPAMIIMMRGSEIYSHRSTNLQRACVGCAWDNHSCRAEAQGEEND
ncbi:MAG: hypothetical protein ACHQNE_00230 [Candidatus Kapaibacterium sp.]